MIKYYNQKTLQGVFCLLLNFDLQKRQGEVIIFLEQKQNVILLQVPLTRNNNFDILVLAKNLA